MCRQRRKRCLELPTGISFAGGGHSQALSTISPPRWPRLSNQLAASINLLPFTKIHQAATLLHNFCSSKVLGRMENPHRNHLQCKNAIIGGVPHSSTGVQTGASLDFTRLARHQQQLPFLLLAWEQTITCTTSICSAVDGSHTPGYASDEPPWGTCATRRSFAEAYLGATPLFTAKAPMLGDV